MFHICYQSWWLTFQKGHVENSGMEMLVQVRWMAQKGISAVEFPLNETETECLLKIKNITEVLGDSVEM